MPIETEIIIAGSGITGSSAAYHLRKYGYNVSILHEKKCITENVPAIAHGEQADLITRTAHAYGVMTAQGLWQFSRQAFREYVDFLASSNISCQKGHLSRYAFQDFEKKELKQAYRMLKPIHGDIVWKESDGRFSLEIPAGVVSAEIQAVLAKLQEGVKKSEARVVDVKESSEGVLVEAAGKQLRCEVFIAASHLDNQALANLPEGSLVSFSDQWSKWEIKGDLRQLEANQLMFWNHGLNQAYIGRGGVLTTWGARYLRRGAGIGDNQSEVLNSVKEGQKKEFLHLFPGYQLEEIKSSALLGCRPCDELPIVGPMFGYSRILLATGYMGQGISMGFFAGKCLAQLVHFGHCNALPRLLWPERLRSLGDS